MLLSFGFALGLALAPSGLAAGCDELAVTPQSILQSLLPPSPYWNDTKSMKEFVVDADSRYLTPAEASNFTETATYEQVTNFFTMLAEDSPYVQIKSIATLANEEDVWLVSVSGEQKFTPNEMNNPIIYATAGIHPGESSGVNAGMMFVRNLVMNDSYKSILDSVNFLFVPIMNVQGYLRQSSNGRINQHGPNTSGRRPNGSFKNLNRDFSKLDTPEVRAIVGVMNEYDVSFYTDMHSDNGINYQADVTWCDNGNSGLSNEIYSWLRTEMQPDLESFLESKYNHKTGVCYYPNDSMDPTAGYYPYFSDGPAYSTNYADHRHIPAYLLEMHSLKPNKQRVLGAYAYLLGLHKIIAEKKDSLRKAIEADRAARVDPVPVAWDYDTPAPKVEWPIFEYEVVTNPVLSWSTRSTPSNPPKRPYAYLIPAVWKEAINVLAFHGIEMEILTEDTNLEVINYRTEDASVNRLREGRPEIKSGDIVKTEICTRLYHKNDVLLKTDQSLGTLAVALLEPSGEGSLFLWGTFSSTLSSPDHPENYIMVPLAERMLNESAELSQEWELYKSENPTYVNDTDKTLEWFFRRSAFYDPASFIYPVAIIYNEPNESISLEPYTLSGNDASELPPTGEGADHSLGSRHTEGFIYKFFIAMTGVWLSFLY